MKTNKQSIDSAWQEMVFLLQAETQRPSRVGEMREKIGVSMSFPGDRGILFHPTRQMDMSYAAGEFLWYLSGRNDLEVIQHYAPSYNRFAEDNGLLWGAYGYRWAIGGQLQKLWKELIQSPDSRRAVLSMYDAAIDLNAQKRDIPCTLTLQFLRRDGRIHLVANMRSNDIWLGFPYDVFVFTALQRMLAELFDEQVGTYTHTVGSLHLYTKNEKKASQLAGQTNYPSLSFSRPNLRGEALAKALLRFEAKFRKEGYSLNGMVEVAAELGYFSFWTMLIGCAALKNHTLTQDDRHCLSQGFIPTPVLGLLK